VEDSSELLIRGEEGENVEIVAFMDCSILKGRPKKELETIFRMLGTQQRQHGHRSLNCLLT
jgi:hypothetical protein